MNGMELDRRNIIMEKLSLEVQVETKVVIVVVIVVAIVALIRTMVVEVEVESALTVESLGILPVSVLVKGAEEVGMGSDDRYGDGGGGGGAMVLIEMAIDLARAIGIVVLEEVQEMTSIIRTLLVYMNVVVKETSVRCRKNTPDRAVGVAAVTCRRCQSLFCCISLSWFSGWTNLLVRSFDAGEALARSSSSSAALVQQQPLVFKYDNGALLKGNVTVDLVRYERFSPTQHSVIVGFIRSLGSAGHPHHREVQGWQLQPRRRQVGPPLGVHPQEVPDGPPPAQPRRKFNAAPGTITVVLAALDVTVEGSCKRCRSSRPMSAFVWVGNSEMQGPGQCGGRSTTAQVRPTVAAAAGDVGPGDVRVQDPV
ncbi:hypothetical protein NL676_039314 [Syzygium grande]|nr:hypothetical protein NL676_039314 [Syzygium grande]